MNIETLAQIVAVASAISAAFHFAILRPLDISIKRIEAMLDRMDKRFDAEAAARQTLEIKVAEVDQRARSAHNRIDEFTAMYARKK